MNLVVVYNPKSGSAPSASQLKNIFETHEHSIEKIITLDDSLAKKLKPFINAKATIVAVGGDGTLSAVAGCLAGTKATFVPIAGGTLNHFVKDLGAKQNLEEVAKHLAHSRVHSIDVAQINDAVFINNSSIGLYPSSLRVRSKLEDTLGKWPAAVFASFSALIRFRTYIVTINKKTVITPFIFVGNNTYRIDNIGGVERTALNKGVLSVFVAKTASRWTLLKIALLAIVGKAHMLHEFDVYETTSLTIKAKHSLAVSRDGEVERFSSPIQYKIRPAALQVRFSKIDDILRA